MSGICESQKVLLF